MAQSQKSRYWSFIIYPGKSAPEDWYNQLVLTHLPICVSPLHDRDVKNDETGELVDPHRHVLVCFDGPTTAKNVNRISQDLLNGTGCVQVYSVRGIYDYFIHPENTGKVPYSEDDRLCLNGFYIEDYTQLTSKEELIIVDSIMDFIQDQAISEYCDLLPALKMYDTTAYDYALHHTILFNTFLTSLRNKAKELKAQELKKQAALKKECC